MLVTCGLPYQGFLDVVAVCTADGDKNLLAQVCEVVVVASPSYPPPRKEPQTTLDQAMRGIKPGVSLLHSGGR